MENKRIKQKILVITALFLGAGNISAAMATITEGHGLPTVTDFEHMTLEQTIAEAALRIEEGLKGGPLEEKEKQQIILRWMKEVSVALKKIKGNEHLRDKLISEQISWAIHTFALHRLGEKVDSCQIGAECGGEPITRENICKRIEGKIQRDQDGRIQFNYVSLGCPKFTQDAESLSIYPHLTTYTALACKGCLAEWRKRNPNCHNCRRPAKDHRHDDFNSVPPARK
jgi:hypothetical protein